MIRWIGWIRDTVCDLGMACRELLYPPRCLCCGGDLSGSERGCLVCGGCSAKLGPEVWQGCRRCGSAGLEGLPAADRCESCRNSVLWFDSVVPLGEYDAELRDAVLRMKKASHDALSTAMGRLLAERRGEQLAEVRADVVVPIPMYWRRRFQRGKNGPDLLASCLARSLQIPIRRSILVRQRNTLPQADLAPAQRLKNVRGAFRVRRPSAVQGARVLLVDDVLTTGATCSEAAKVLKQAGAALVAVAIVARARRRW
jgi:ComF family protein